MKISAAFWFLIVTCLVHIWFIIHPASALYVYQNGVFPLWRISFDYTLGNLNFPLVYLLLTFLVFYFFYVLYQWKFTSVHLKKKTKRIVASAGKKILVGIALFFWLWGFNYYQPDFSSRFGMVQTSIDTQDVKTEIHNVIYQLNTLRRSISDTLLFDFGIRKEELESSLRSGLEPLLVESGWNVYGRVRVRALKPEGVLLRFSAAGIYFPYSMEGHYDQGLHILQIPFTLAHEMAHGYGVTSEGDCNLLALVVTLQAKDPLIQYCGLLTYYRYLRSDRRFINDIEGLLLDEKVKSDLVDIRMNSQKFPDIFPFWRDFVYDWYLRMMGVEDGIQNYYALIDNFIKVRKIKKDWAPEYLIQ